MAHFQHVEEKSTNVELNSIRECVFWLLQVCRVNRKNPSTIAQFPVKIKPGSDGH